MTNKKHVGKRSFSLSKKKIKLRKLVSKTERISFFNIDALFLIYEVSMKKTNNYIQNMFWHIISVNDDDIIQTSGAKFFSSSGMQVHSLRRSSFNFTTRLDYNL